MPGARKGLPSWLWALIAVPLSCGGCGLGGFLFIRAESPYEAAVARAQQHPKVRKVLGEPISAAFFFSGKMRVKNETGAAAMQISLSGEKQDGTLIVNAVQAGAGWGFSQLDVVAADGSVINIVDR